MASYIRKRFRFAEITGARFKTTRTTKFHLDEL